MNRNFWLLRGLRFLAFAALFVAVAGFVTMSLWNWLVPTLFHGPILSFSQALGLLLLSRLLFGGFRGGQNRASWTRQKEVWRKKMESRMASMTPEEQEKFRQKMYNSCSMPWTRRQVTEPSQTAQVE